MTYVPFTLRLALSAMLSLGGGFISACIILPIRRYKLRKQSREKTQKALEKLGNVRLKPGGSDTKKGRRRPWGRKWINYANGVPAPKGRYSCVIRELPPTPRKYTKDK